MIHYVCIHLTLAKTHLKLTSTKCTNTHNLARIYLSNQTGHLVAIELV